MSMKKVSDELMEILVCPVCRKSVTRLDSSEGIRCSNCNLIYPVTDGIPVMLTDEAVKG